MLLTRPGQKKMTARVEPGKNTCDSLLFPRGVLRPDLAFPAFIRGVNDRPAAIQDHRVHPRYRACRQFCLWYLRLVIRNVHPVVNGVVRRYMLYVFHRTFFEIVIFENVAFQSCL